MTKRTTQTIWRKAPSGGIPNNPNLPAVLIRDALDAPTPDAIKIAYARNGWGGSWVWTVFDYHHFHPASHEVLTCARGWAELMLGGPDGETVRIEAGDMAVLPAGFGHCRLASGDGFTMVGAYPAGQEEREILRADPLRVPGWLERIRATPLPETDPVFGPDGPLVETWRMR